MPAPSTAKTVSLILSLVEQGEYYSAHLKARSTVARLLKSSDYDEKAKEGAGVLFTAAQALLQKGQAGSGTDLALYLVDTWATRGVACGDEERAQITQLIALTGRSENWRQSIISAATSWTAKTGESPAGDEQLHLYIGEMLIKEKDYGAAESHLLACPTRDSARVLAQMLYDWSLLDGHKTQGAGRYAARGVLSYLEGSSILAARIFLQHFLHLFLSANSQFLSDGTSITLPSRFSKSSQDEQTQFQLTTLATFNFLQLVILTCQAGIGQPVNPAPSGASASAQQAAGKGGGRAAWQSLWSKYEKDIVWLKAPTLKAAQTSLGEIYFGMKQPTQANPMANLLSGLFGGGGGSAQASGSRRIASPGLD